MERLISYCGLVCSECGAFLATQNNDDAARRKVAEEWSKAYRVEVKPEDVNCSGCIRETEPVFSYCRVCEIRACGRGKKVKNCGYCLEYPCDKLSKFFEMAPAARKNLEAVRKKREKK